MSTSTPQENQALDPALGEWLKDLKDIHLPLEAGWWPPAPGWWILSMLVFILAAFLAVRIAAGMRRHFRTRRITQFTADGLKAIQSRIKNENVGDLPEAVAAMFELVKRFIAVHSGRERIGGLHGDQWLGFLQSTASFQGAAFQSQSNVYLASLPYRSSDQLEALSVDEIDVLKRDLIALGDQLIQWVRTFAMHQASAEQTGAQS